MSFWNLCRVSFNLYKYIKFRSWSSLDFASCISHETVYIDWKFLSHNLFIVNSPVLFFTSFRCLYQSRIFLFFYIFVLFVYLPRSLSFPPRHTYHQLIISSIHQIHDWLHMPTEDKFVLRHHGGGDDFPESMLINGLGPHQVSLRNVPVERRHKTKYFISATMTFVV